MDTYYIIDYLQKITGAINRLKNQSEKIGRDKSILAFRGEGKDYGKTRLMPSIFRKQEYLDKEKYLFELLRDYSIIDEQCIRSIDKAIQAQHYVSISRMLDITFNVLPALYFACEDENNRSENGKLYIFLFPEHYSPSSQYLDNYYSSILNREKLAYSRNIKVMTSCFLNSRIQQQDGGFIFFPGNQFSSISKAYYETIDIESKHKESLCREIKELFDIDAFSIYPEIDNKASRVKSKYEIQNAFTRDLTLKAEVESYFERVEYELQLMEIKENWTAIDIHRQIRKEREDLIQFISESGIKKEDSITLIDEANRRFEELNNFFV